MLLKKSIAIAWPVWSCLVSSQGLIQPNLTQPLTNCKGYSVANLRNNGFVVEADLDLIGDGCAAFSPDIPKLSLYVEYESVSRLRVLIQDREHDRYQVPDAVLPRPSPYPAKQLCENELVFEYTQSPFSFKIIRRLSGEILFDTYRTSLIFEQQFLRLRTQLPPNPNIYGLGEHSDTLRLNTTKYIRTFWAGDTSGTPEGTNSYGEHPIYFEHRSTGTHGVLLVNSNGMDIHLDQDSTGSNYLEYNTIGGVLDLYFLAGPSPAEVSRQYSAIVGQPAMIPYWSLGFHNCRYGYQDWFDVAETVYNYSLAGIPLETQWTDIDYMDGRKIFTLDPQRFSLENMQAMIQWLHNRGQRYVMMLDPAVAATDYPAYDHGADLDIFLKYNDSSYFEGVVWPGIAVFPDWFHPDVQEYWSEQIQTFFDADSGLDIDGLRIDMNEPTNFCNFPCPNPIAEAEKLGNPPDPPPVRTPPRTIPGFPYPSQQTRRSAPTKSRDVTRTVTEEEALIAIPYPNVSYYHLDDDLLYPGYMINNSVAAGQLSNLTARTDIIHFNGEVEYDVHNLFGTMMAMRSFEAMLGRRPGLRTFIITRSSYAGAGRYVQKWLGDNVSTWAHYRRSIAGILSMAAFYQIPMSGADVCGFLGNTTETLCARWTSLGAFSPFFRNHNVVDAIRQEFYRWPMVTSAAKYAIDIRYRLMDYFYTEMSRQSTDGTPALNPLWFLYPQDENTWGLDLQYFFGDCILISPVTEENSTSVDIYLPDDIFYDWETKQPIRGRGDWVTLANVPMDRIPIHIRGGCVVPLRSESANTTEELREKGFEILVAPGLDGKAAGCLLVDDGVSLDGGPAKTMMTFHYDGIGLTNETITGLGCGITLNKVTVLS